jgi:hypothetical protein
MSDGAPRRTLICLRIDAAQLGTRRESRPLSSRNVSGKPRRVRDNGTECAASRSGMGTATRTAESTRTAGALIHRGGGEMSARRENKGITRYAPHHLIRAAWASGTGARYRKQ